MENLKYFFVLVLFFLLHTTLTAQNISPQFSELKGMEDAQGNTHLLYRIFSSTGAYPEPYSSNNSIYHLDLSTNTDAFFLYDGGSYSPFYNYWKTVEDYSFWDNDPSKYIYCGTEIGMDPIGYVQRYDQQSGLFFGFGGFNVDISRQNDSLLFVNLGFILISTDGGINWDDLVQQTDFNFISLSPFNDDIMFGYSFTGELLKSTNRGINYTVVDTFKSGNSYSIEFYYDSDENHLYRINRHFPYYYLSISDNNGEQFSWQIKYESNDPFFISIDNSQSGTIYLNNNKKILRSTDFGNTFTPYKELENRIIGIYKKPNSDILYAATKYRIYEITDDTITIIKSLPVPQEFFAFYPLSIGNYWIYKMEIWDNWPVISYSEDTFTREVVSKETLSNNKEYFKIEEIYHGSSYTNYVYERIDSVNGHVYRFDNECSNPDSEKVIDDFTSEVGDSLLNQRFTECWDSILTLFSEAGSENIFNENRNFRSFEYYSLLSHTYKLAQGLGIYNMRWGYDFGSTDFILKGCVTDGIVYGDTTLTDVTDENELPKEFSLSQNYPNPFNPSTKIKFTIPSVETHRDASLLTTLKVYDVLGNEVATLVDEFRPAGSYDVNFDASNLSSGVYFYQLKVGSFFEAKKMILIK